MNELISLAGENEELTTQVSLVRGQIQDQSVELSGASRAITLLTSRIRKTEEAIEAIDQHRRQLNSTITELRTELKLRQSGDTARNPG